MALNGYIKLHRKLREWGWYSDSVVKDVFIELLLTATYIESSYKGHELKPGQVVVGRKKLADTLGFSEQQIRTALKKLQSTGEISVFSTNKFSIVTIKNWVFYQVQDEESNQQSTNNQPTNNQQSTNNQPHLKKTRIQEIKNTRSVCIDDALARAKPFFGIFDFGSDVIAALEMWIMYKAGRGDTYTDDSLFSLVNLVREYVDSAGSMAVVKVINESIANGYKNIVFDRLDKR